LRILKHIKLQLTVEYYLRAVSYIFVLMSVIILFSLK